MFYNKRIFKRCFPFRGWRWYKNIKYIPLYFKLIHKLIRDGYDDYATWETCNWFIDTMKDILIEYRAGHISYPVINDCIGLCDDELEFSSEIWNGIVDQMILLLDCMDENSYTYDDITDFKMVDKQRIQAKDEFFKLFSKYFYHLWD